MTDTNSGEPIEIAVLGLVAPAIEKALSERFTIHKVYAAPNPFDALRAIGPRIRGCVSHGMAGISRAQMEVMPKLEIVAINGVGLETSDLKTAKERNVVITTTPVLFDDVADLAVGLALDACRRITFGDKYVRAGKWLEKRAPVARKLSGMRAGIIGLGRIGIEVAKRLEGFKCAIGYVDPMARDVPYRRFPDSVEMAKNSDILFLCAAGAPKGAGKPLVDKAIIDALGPRGTFVNISRGWLVDEKALVSALSEGRLGAAGLDVFDDEPRVPDALLKLDNVVLTPHIASSTEETTKGMADLVVANLFSWFDGKGALTPVA